MRSCLIAFLLLFGVAGWGQTKGPRTFELTLPENWSNGKNVVLVLKDLEVPENRGVVFRLFPAGQSDVESLASVSVVARSRNAKGVQHFDELAMNLSGEFRQWAERAKRGNRISVIVKPYAGLHEANDYPWHVKELKLEVR